MTLEVESSESWSHRFLKEAPLHVPAKQMEVGEGGRALTSTEPAIPRNIWAWEGGTFAVPIPPSFPPPDPTHRERPSWAESNRNTSEQNSEP